MGEDPKYRTLPERMLTRLDFPPLRRKVFRNQGFIHVRVGRGEFNNVCSVPNNGIPSVARWPDLVGARPIGTIAEHRPSIMSAILSSRPKNSI